MPESIADVYYERTGERYLYNITAIENIPSIMRRGIICYDFARKLQHNSIAINDVQARRARKRVPNGLRLHQYANLYFTYHNPMMYRRQDMAETICVLVLFASVLDIEECVVSDMNAATDLVRFYPAYEGIEVLDFDKIFAAYWTHSNVHEHRMHKAIKCAEILIPHKISSQYIVGAYVVSNESKRALESKGFDKEIIVRPSVFFH